MRIGQTLAIVLTGFTLLAFAGSAQAQEPIESLKNKVLSFQNSHAVTKISSVGPIRTLTILPGTCPMEVGLTLQAFPSEGLDPFFDIGLDSGFAMQWGTIAHDFPGNRVGDLTSSYLQQRRLCPVVLEPGTRIVSIKMHGKAGFNSHISALLLEGSSGVVADPLESFTDGCGVWIDNQTAGYDPARTSYSSPCPLRVKDEKAYVLTLTMFKSAGDDASANVLQSVQIQYYLLQAGTTIPTRVNGTN